MRRVVTLLVLGLFLVVACASTPPAPPAWATDTPIATPTSTPPRSSATIAAPLPSPTPTPRPTPFPVVGQAQLEGRILIRRGADLWIVSPQDPSRDRQLTQGAKGLFGAAYGGLVRTADAFDLYFSKIEKADRQVPEIGVYVWHSLTEQTEQLFKFVGGTKDDELSTTNISIRPDGAVLAYSADGDIRLRDLRAGTETTFLRANRGCAQSSSQCWGNFIPRWTRDGLYLSFTRFYWEGTRRFTLDPNIPVVEPLIPGKSSSVPEAGARTGPSCDVPDAPVIDLRATADPGDGVSRVVTPRSDERYKVHADTCGWSTDGRLALSYLTFDMATPVDSSDHTRATFRILDAVLKTVVSVEPAPGTFSRWLPTGDALLMAGRRQPQPTTEPLPQWFTVSQDGSVRSLAIDADSFIVILPN